MISVIVPLYNSRNTIGGCISSLLKQSAKESYEIIVVDDGSDDGSYEVAKAFEKSKKVRVVRQPHGGPAKARNRGARLARGSILVFTDADCLADRKFLENITRAFRDKNTVGVQGSYKTDQKSLVSRFAQLEIEERYERMKRAKNIDFIGSYACAYRKREFFEAGGFDESFPMASGEDPALSFKLSKMGYRLVFSPNAVVYHRHPEKLTRYLKQKFYRAYWRVTLYKKFPEKIKSESYTPQSLKLEIMFFYAFILSFLPPILKFFPLPTIFPLSLIFLFSLPLALKNARKDLKVGLLTPIFIFLRTAVFSLGLLAGAFWLIKEITNR